MAKTAAEYGLIFVPGIEVTTIEEVHVLTYFSDVDTAVTFGETLYDSLPDIQNRPDIFGNQIIMDERDHQKGTLNKLLLQATPFSLDDLVRMAKAAGGCAVPAHINRDSFSILANLGFLPPGIFGCVEVVKGLPCPDLDSNLKVLHSSDAHNLGTISEPSEMLSSISSANEFIYYVNSF
jgi:hypothetical protein